MSIAAPPTRRAPTRSGAPRRLSPSSRPTLTALSPSRAGRAARDQRLFCPVHRPVAAMHAAQLAGPADARQPRPHDERSRAAQERQLAIRKPSGARSSGNWRRTIAARNIAPPPRPPARPASSTRCSAATSSARAATARHPAPSARCACAPATAFISRSRTRRCRTASPTTSAPASGCAPRPKPRSTAYRNPGEDMNQAVSSPAASPTPSCRTRSGTARSHAGLLLPPAGPELGRRAQERR